MPTMVKYTSAVLIGFGVLCSAACTEDDAGDGVGGASGHAGFSGSPGSGGTAGSAGSGASAGSSGSGGFSFDAGADSSDASGGTAGSVSEGGADASGTDAGDAGPLDASDGGPACAIPDSQVLTTLHAGATLTFTAPGAPIIEVGTASSATANEPDSWTARSTLTLPADGAPYSIKVFARVSGTTCPSAARFEHVYQVVGAFDPAAGQPGSLAVPKDAANIVGWATGFVSPVAYGSEVDDAWRTPAESLGQAGSDLFHIVCTGNGGHVVLTFDPPIADADGADFAVFENAFNDTFLELAYVEVSSDGTNFVRFDTAYLGTVPVAGFEAHQAANLHNLAGKYRQGFGTPYDLSLLRYRALVQTGAVNLRAITHVRIVDIVGNGASTDSFGRRIYDPTPTTGSGGFDLDAIAVLNR
jgi:hypothetical protein